MSANMRGTNFTEKDETILFGIVDKYKNVVECKRTDGKTNLDKKEIWKTIVQEFNAISQSRRTANQLTNRRELIKTGGGTFVKKI